MAGTRRDYGRLAVLTCALAGLFAGLALWATGRSDAADLVWTLGVLPALLALAIEIARSLGRGETGLDIVALLSMSSALLFGETLAAAVVAMMYAGGTYLESFAEGRARREMHALLARVPRSATLIQGDTLREVPLDALVPGDRLLIRMGDVVPVDGTLASDTAYVDTSALTGESLPARLARGQGVMSGSTNAGDAFDLVATHPARDSTYAGIVRLVDAAQQSRAPMVRMADRWSLGFLAVTLIIAGLAWWLSGDPIRAVAVLVVATPCPLILAVPVALVAGLSRAAHFGVLIKGAAPLEAMARARVLILDKTGTLTVGQPQIVSIETMDDTLSPDAVLAMAASLDQVSKHPVALAVVAEARARGLVLDMPDEVVETPGEGVTGRLAGRQVAVGGTGFVAARAAPFADAAVAAGSVQVAVAVDGRMVGILVMADPLRPEAGAMLGGLREQGITRISLATGDRPEVAQQVAGGLGLDAIHAGLSPDAKLALVSAERAWGPVVMVGDGVNDAPALAAADVGVAMGVRGAAASAEAADVVLLVDRIDRLAMGLQIARGARAIALQSVVVGLGLSVIAMLAAAAGLLNPVQGALLQEVIDVAVILNALRALAITPRVLASR